MSLWRLDVRATSSIKSNRFQKQLILFHYLFVELKLRTFLCDLFPLQNLTLKPQNRPMTEKEIVLETIRSLPDDCSLEEIAERIEFMAAGTERSRPTR